MKKRESVKLKESMKNTKQEPREHNQRRYVLSELICSTCNRKFRAKSSINSHQRTYNHTGTQRVQD